MAIPSVDKSAVKQLMALLVVVLVLIAVSVGGTLYATGRFSGDDAGNRATTYKNMTMLDAQLICEEQARQQLGRRIKNLSVDTHSSRYDEYDDRFKVFFHSDLYATEARKGFASFFYINCYTRSDREVVTAFTVEEDKDFKPKAIRKEKGGTFGY